MIQSRVQPAGAASPTLAKGVVAVPEPLTSEMVTQTVLRLHEGALPSLNHWDTWRVPSDTIVAMERLMAIVEAVRSPAGGWPSDREANAENLLPYVMDEAMDVLEGLEKSWTQADLPASHPLAPLQKLLDDRLILADAIAHFLWGIARSSVDTMQLLGGIPAEYFQAGLDWTPGILRLMAVFTLQTPTTHWVLDLVTAEPPLPELHRDTLVRWSGSSVFWVEAFLQSLERSIQEVTPLLKGLLDSPIASDIIAPGQPWQKGTLKLHLSFTFTPHAVRPTLNLLTPPLDLSRSLPQKTAQTMDWDEYCFTLAPGLAEVLPIAPLDPPDPVSKTPSPQEAALPRLDLSDTALFEDWEEPPSHSPAMENPGLEGEGDLFGSWGTDAPPENAPEQTSPPDFEIVLGEDFKETMVTVIADALAPTIAPVNPESWNLEHWRIRWPEHPNLLPQELEPQEPNQKDSLVLPRRYYVKQLLQDLNHQGDLLLPEPTKEGRLLHLVDLACQALAPAASPLTLLSTQFVLPESTVAELVQRFAWFLIRDSYGLTCLLSGINAQILQPEWGWESGILRLLPILQLQSALLETTAPAIDVQIDLSTAAPAPLETVLVMPDILINIEGTDWPDTRVPVFQFRTELLGRLHELLPELEVLRHPVAVELADETGVWQPITIKIQFELGFQAI